MKHTMTTIAFSGMALIGCTLSLSETEARVESMPLSIQESEGGITCKADGVYPHIENLLSTQIELNINAVIETYVHAIEQDMARCPAMMADLAEEGATLTDSTDLSFSVKRLDQDYFSVVLVHSQYFEGAAHPRNSIFTETFSLMDGQPIALSEWFDNPEDGEAFLVEQINNQLTADDMGMTYPSESSNGLGSYFITDTELVLTDLYSVHAVQGYEVRIPFADMTEVMRPDATL